MRAAHKIMRQDGVWQPPDDILAQSPLIKHGARIFSACSGNQS
jgi:hypothetical protein